MSVGPTPDKPIPFGRYQLVEHLATGGMAEIYKAKVVGAHGFEKTCVIKRILPQLAEDFDGEGEQKSFVDRFIDEAKVMVRLNHPKVVQVLDFGEVGGQYFMAMEYVQGIDGSALLRRCAHLRRRPTTGIAVHIAAEVLDALDNAHNLADEQGLPLGLVHRDVSPSNIFISELGEVKLGDFGIARVAAWHERTDPGGLKGKYGYMSPEAVAEGVVTHRSDLFAVGVVLAELLMVRRLFISDSPLEVLLKVRDVDLERLDQYGQHIHPELREILESALARDPRLRFQDAATFRDTLHRHLFDHKLMVRNTEVQQFMRRLDQLEREASTAPPKPTAERRAVVAPDLAADSAAVTMDVKPPASASAPEFKSAAAAGPSVHEEKTRDLRRSPIKQEGAATAASSKEPPRRRRKRKISLGPPPRPEPVPTGMPGTGEAPRIATSDALAAVPEVAGSSSAADEAPFFKVEAYPEIEVQPSALADSARAAEEDAGEVAASRLSTPITEPAPMPPPDRQGELAEESPVRVLFRLAVEEATGLLVLRRNQVVKEIYLEEGDPEYVASNLPQELFGQYLVQKGVITEGELSMALAMLPHFHGKLGNTLVALKLLRPMEVLRHLTHQVRQKLLDVFGWEGGTYGFYRNKVFEQEAAPLGLDAFEMIAAGVEAMPTELLQRRLGPLRGLRLRAKSPPPVPPEVFRLGGRAQEAFDKLDGQHTLDELLSRFDDEDQRDQFGRVAYLLAETGMAERLDDEG